MDSASSTGQCGTPIEKHSVQASSLRARVSGVQTSINSITNATSSAICSSHGFMFPVGVHGLNENSLQLVRVAKLTLSN